MTPLWAYLTSVGVFAIERDGYNRPQTMRIVLVTQELPHPPFTGAHVRPLSMLAALAAHHEVIVAGPAPHGAELGDLEARYRVVRFATSTAARGRARATLSTARRSLSPVPLIARSRSAALQIEIERTVRDCRPDAIQLENMYMSHYRVAGLPAVIDLLDVVSGLCAAARAARPVRYAMAGIQQLAAAHSERRILRDFAAVIAINDEDRARLENLGIAAVTVPLAIDPPSDATLASAVRRTEAPGTAPTGLLFVGNFAHHPNRAAAAWLERRLAPELRRRGLPFRLTIAGRHARPYGSRRDPDVVFRADAPDLGPLYAAADIVVVPLEYGGGTKNKTLEAMAWARPVVGAPQAFTGLAAAADNAFAVCALDAAAMAGTLEKLARDPAARTHMGAAARRYVLEHHSQERVTDSMLRVYERIEAQKEPAAGPSVSAPAVPRAMWP